MINAQLRARSWVGPAAAAGLIAIALTGCAAQPELETEQREANFLAAVGASLDVLGSDLEFDEETLLQVGRDHCVRLESYPEMRDSPITYRVAAEVAGIETAEFTVVAHAIETHLCPAP